ncbi:MAG: sigma 54-interacting transcriptional regulator [Leptospiraceae bacterium]|nr:sigma 54-interacting transcriptional regulator [Leptospiraceae bacterium]
MNRIEDPEEILDGLLSDCIEATEADSGSIMLLDNKREYLEARVVRGLNLLGGKLRLKVGEGVTGWVAREGKIRLVGNASEEQDYIRLKEDLQSELAVPMMARGELIGVLSVDARRSGAFTREDADFLGIMGNLASQIFVRLEDNRLLKIRDRFHQVMMEISRVVSHSLKLQEVFREIMQITEKAFRLHRSTLFLYSSEEDSLMIAAASGIDDREAASIRYAPGEGITGGVFQSKKAIFIPSVKNEAGFLNRMKTVPESGDMGYFCCPIFSGTEVVGVFSTFTHPQTGVDPESVLEFLEILGSIISQAITIQRLVQEETRVIATENLKLKQELSSRYQFGSLIGRSTAMLRLFEKVRIIADSRASVLLTGESGTGKELIASAIHYNSPRRDRPFIKINCAAIPENLLESELFGHRKGAFTGAVGDKKGKFEIADGGTIFLDEIGEMDLNLQSKLLRVLQEREIEPVGGKTRQVDIRVIAATNADLEDRIVQKQFRADLYYRLNVINLRIPALRDRKEDIVLLVHHFMEKYSKENNKKIAGISHDAMRMLEGYEWPGNVRELENVIERAAVMAQRDILDTEDFTDVTLPFSTEAKTATSGPATPVTAVEGDPESPSEGPSEDRGALAAVVSEDELDNMEGRVYETVISEVERRLIIMALKKFRYTKTRAARYLGINRNTLDKKIKELEIDY